MIYALKENTRGLKLLNEAEEVMSITYITKI